jgi:2-amino-4-hydroxy-6-hydroxymethyldihydropteridine diphosphokinase
MIFVLIGLGSNLGNGKNHLRLAWSKLADIPGIHALKISSPYRTKPMGMESSQWFTNAAASLETELSATELLAVMQEVENEFGRDRKKTKDRNLDLDLLFYGSNIIDLPNLTVPHPEIAKRLFVLCPLQEIAPDFIHPVLKTTALELQKLIFYQQNQIVKQDW